MKIEKLAIIGDSIVTTEAEAFAAAREALNWNGSSEGDGPLEVIVTDSEAGKFEVWETWGSRVTRDSGINPEPVAVFDMEKEADDFANRHNSAALAASANCDWIALPIPLDFVYFGGCRHGKYPQSRLATITATADGVEIEASGFGNAPFLRDIHSAEALRAAVANLVRQLEDLKKTSTNN